MSAHVRLAVQVLVASVALLALASAQPTIEPTGRAADDLFTPTSFSDKAFLERHFGEDNGIVYEHSVSG
jgi:hypothetical protein